MERKEIAASRKPLSPVREFHTRAGDISGGSNHSTNI